MILVWAPKWAPDPSSAQNNIIGTLVLASGYFVWGRRPNREPVDDIAAADVAEDSELSGVEHDPTDGLVIRSIAVLPADANYCVR